MHLQRRQATQVGREEQVLHFVRDGQFAFQPLLLLLLGNQPGQRFRHGIKRLLQGRHLVLRAHRDTVREVAAIDVSRRVIEVGDRLGNAARQPHANHQRHQLDQAEEDGNPREHVDKDPRFLAQSAEQGGVEHRRARVNQDQAVQRFAAVPVNRTNSRGKRELKVKAVGGRRNTSGLNPPAFVGQAHRGA